MSGFPLVEAAKAIDPGVQITDRYLVIPKGLEWEKVEALADMLVHGLSAMPLLYGDLLNQVEAEHQDEWTQLLSESLGRNERTVTNWRYVARNIPKEIRPDLRDISKGALYAIAKLRSTRVKEIMISAVIDWGMVIEDTREASDLLLRLPSPAAEATIAEAAYDEAVDSVSFLEILRRVAGETDPDVDEDLGDDLADAQAADELIDNLVEDLEMCARDAYWAVSLSELKRSMGAAREILATLDGYTRARLGAESDGAQAYEADIIDGEVVWIRPDEPGESQFDNDAMP